MGELIKRQDAINAVMQNYCYESDRMTALQELPVITDEKRILRKICIRFVTKLIIHPDIRN